MKTVKKSMDFSSLPYRVIVYDVLPFVEINTQKLDKYDLFGYFKKDRQRKLFMVFSSIQIVTAKTKCMIDLTSIKSLRLDIVKAPEKDHTSSLILQNTKMLIKCETFKLRIAWINPNFRVNLSKFGFFQPGSLPSIKSLELRGDAFNAMDKWDSSHELWKQLRSLSLMLKDSNFDFPSNYTLKLPNIELLEIEGCKNLNISEINQKVRYIRYSGEGHMIKEILNKRKHVGLKKLVFFPEGRNRDISWMFDYSENFENIETINVRNMIFPIDPKPAKFFKNLKTLQLTGINEDSNYNDEILCHDFPKLEKLYFCQIKATFGEKSFPWTKSIKTVHFQRVKLHNNFLQKNVFGNLKNLVLISSTIGDNLESKPGNYSQNLEKLVFDGVGITDSYFEKMEFPNLKELLLANCEGLKNPKNWNISGENLERISIHRQEDLDVDLFLVGKKCPKLKELELYGDLKKCDGLGWNMPNLEHLLLTMVDIKDCFFQEQSFEKLKTISFDYCKKLAGKKWNRFSNVERVSISGCENIRKDIAEGKDSPFPENVDVKFY